MAAFKTKPLKILQGSTFDKTFTWKAGDPSVAVDLTGCTARAQIRQTHKSTTVLHEMTTENGGIELGGTAGTIRMLIDAEDTEAMTFSVAVYDLEIIFADGTVQRKLEGQVTLSKEVTR